MRDRREACRTYQQEHTLVRMKQFNQEQSKHRIVFLGDSITEHFDLDKYFHGGVNRGISADTTKGVFCRLEEVKALEPSYIVLLIGTNDLGNEYMSPDEVYQGVREIIDALKGYKVILQLVLPVNEQYDLIQTNQQINQLNFRLLNLMSLYEIKIISTRLALEDHQGHLDERFTDDGLHLNDAGYDALAVSIIEKLEL